MTQKDRALLRAIFDEAAELYDRARPGYPAALFDDLAEVTPLRPGSRVDKVADALRPGGSLATVTTHHVAGGDESFFADVQTCYVRWDPDTPTTLTLRSATDIPSSHYGLDQSDRFGPAVLRRYEWDRSYTTASYLELLLTYSGHRALDPKAQRNLLGCIAHLIDTDYGGQITKRYLTELRVAPAVGP